MQSVSMLMLVIGMYDLSGIGEAGETSLLPRKDGYDTATVGAGLPGHPYRLCSGGAQGLHQLQTPNNEPWSQRLLSVRLAD